MRLSIFCLFAEFDHYLLLFFTSIDLFNFMCMFIDRVIWEESVMQPNATDSDSKTTVPLEIKATNSESVVHEREIYIIVYTIIMVIGTFCYLSRSFSFYRMCLRISINLHDMIFRGVTRAKMLFFNNNPSGRILNRFARDINNVDSLLPNIIVDVLDVSIFKKCPTFFYFNG